MLIGKALQCRLDKQRLRPTVTAAVTVAAGFAAVYLSFLTANAIYYGRPVGVDIKEWNFTAALSALESIDDGGAPTPYVPVSNGAIRQAAEVSPTFRPLAASLEGPLKVWQSHGCAQYSWTCGQFAGGWFVWALRDAGASNGFYASPAIESREFGKVADEIRQACDQGRLRCRARLVDLVPPITPEQWWKIPGATLNAIRLISLVSVPSIGEPQPISESEHRDIQSLLAVPEFSPCRSADCGDDRLRVVLQQGGRQRVAGFSGRRRSYGYCDLGQARCKSRPRHLVS